MTYRDFCKKKPKTLADKALLAAITTLSVKVYKKKTLSEIYSQLVEEGRRIF